MVVVDRPSIRKFVHYCGIFAVLELFVELAVPTSLAMAARKIVTEADLPRRGKALWTEEDAEEIAPFGRDLDALMRGFPADTLYYHPIKLSAWKTAIGRSG